MCVCGGVSLKRSDYAHREFRVCVWGGGTGHQDHGVKQGESSLMLDDTR